MQGFQTGVFPARVFGTRVLERWLARVSSVQECLLASLNSVLEESTARVRLFGHVFSTAIFTTDTDSYILNIHSDDEFSPGA